LHERISTARSDIFAGVAVAAIEIPTALAYAQLAGFPAVVGLYASILPLVAYAAVGSSRQLIVGPDAATCTMVSATLMGMAAGNAARYLDLSITLSFVVGALCVIAGSLRLGSLANLLSRPILVGFLNGIALTIISSQLGKLFGISVRMDTGFFLRVGDFASKLGATNFPTLVIGIVTLLLILLFGKMVPRVPGALVGVIVGMAMMKVLHFDVYPISRVGNVPSGLPVPHFPRTFLADALQLLPDAGSIFLICFCSSMPTAKSFALRNGYEVDANRELLALGMANFASAVSKGFVVAGADSRTAINDQAGGRTQVSGISAAIIMSLILVFAAGILESIPTASLAAILILAGVALLDFRAVQRIYEISRAEFILSIITTLGVATVGVLAGVVLAVALSLILLLIRASNPYDATLGKVPGMDGFTDMNEFSEAKPMPGLVIYRFDAALLFFNCDYFKRRVRHTITSCELRPRYFIFDMEAVNAIDVTGMESLEEIRAELISKGIVIIVARAKLEVRSTLSRGGLTERIGIANFHRSIRDAVRWCLTNSPEINLGLAIPDFEDI
jgi:high affinity sulfate transporter 1